MLLGFDCYQQSCHEHSWTRQLAYLVFSWVARLDHRGDGYFVFLRDSQTVSQSGPTILHSQEPCSRGSVPTSLSTLGMVSFPILAILIGPRAISLWFSFALP